jgi:Fe-S cluster assembly ATPase SufC
MQDNRPRLDFTSIKGANSTFQSEKFSILIGRNGSGKSALLSLIHETYPHRNSNDEVIEFSARHFFNFGEEVDFRFIKSNSLILIANIESGLGSDNIRKLIEELNNLTDEKNCVVIGITYSPIVLNEFTGKEYSIFVFPDDSEKGLLPLDTFKNPDWTAHFELGILYDREKLF